MKLLIDLLILAGSCLMVYNIVCYFRFSVEVRTHETHAIKSRLFLIPIVLLVLFLAGYVIIGLFGNPDLVTSGILFGGSLFVMVMLLLIRRTFARIRENEHLEAQLSAAEEANKAKTFFLSNMSHDIRTPLNAIIGYTAIAKGDNVTPQQKTAYLEKIETAGHQLLDIVNDVLEMSRIESGKLELHPALMDLEDCVRQAGNLVQMQFDVKHIHFTVDTQMTHKWVLCDRNLLNRVLMNLLGNAGKFTPEDGSVFLSMREISANGETGQYELCVRDTGIGMSPEFVEHLFTPFERERTSTVSKAQGTGLGMAITKSIIELMGGTIEVQTEKDKGTAFTIRVSYSIGEPPEEKAPAQDRSLRFDGMRTLLAEDNLINLEISKVVLEQSGFLVETAENGRIAVDKVQASEPGYYDVVLMDIQMPQMNGYEAAQAIRALDNRALAEVPILAMTANVFQEDIRHAYDAGMNGYIAKPLDIPRMMETLDDILHPAEK